MSSRLLSCASVLIVVVCAGREARAQDVRPASKPAQPATAAPAPEPLTVEEVLREGAKFRPVAPSQWMFSPDGRACFVRPSPDGEALTAVSAEDERSTTIVAAKELSDAAAKLGLALDPRRLPALAFGDGGRTVLFTAASADGKKAGRVRLVLATGAATLLLSHPADAEAVVYAREDRVAYVSGRDVFVGLHGGEVRRVTTGGGPDLKHGLSSQREEFGIKDGLWFDPTGRRIAYFREDLSPIAPYPFADYRTVPAAAVHGRYPMAGRRQSTVTIGVHDLDTGATAVLDTRPELDRWLTNVTFSPDGSRLYVAVVGRGQDRVDVREYDATTGAELRTVFGESDPQWTEPEHGPLFPPGAPDRFLWHSPRDGFRHLYIYDLKGDVVRQITRGPRDVAEFVGFSPDAAYAYYLASDDDPKTMHLWRASLVDGKNERLTNGRGRRRAVLSADGRSVLLLREDAVTPPVLERQDLATGKTVALFETPDPFKGRRLPDERFFTVEGPGGGLLHGHVMLPPDRKPDARYPLLWYVYGGPHSQLVVDTFGSGADNWLRAMASSGYVVARVDGRGTDNRGIDWLQAIHRKVGTLEIDDQLAALAYIKGLPEVDPARAGVFGWSFGGFMAASLMCRAPEAFKAGVAGAPVTDWALYETGYGERYMDTPAENPEGYAESDVANHLKKLKGRLLIVHGTSDDVVVPQHTMRLVDRAVQDGVELEFFPYPGHRHAVTGRARLHLYRKLTAFFAQSL